MKLIITHIISTVILSMLPLFSLPGSIPTRVRVNNDYRGALLLIIILWKNSGNVNIKI